MSKILPKKEVDAPWKPLSPGDAIEVMGDFDGPWWIAGGYSIEFLVGNSFREHEDLDIIVLREDLGKLQGALLDWELFPSDPPGTLRIWDPNELLPEEVHDIWARPKGKTEWAFQFMVTDSSDGKFLYKRDHSIKFDMAEMTSSHPEGFKYLAPHLQLLYKAKGLRQKDQSDFEQALPKLMEDQRQWLSQKLEKCYGKDHPWLAKLEVFSNKV